MADQAVIRIWGDGVTALVSGGRVADLEALRNLPEIRHVWLNGVRPSEAVLRFIAGLPQIAALTISGIRFTAEKFAFLDALPPGAAVKIYDYKHDNPAWNAFRRRRANRVARLSPALRQEAAVRYACGMAAMYALKFDGGRTVSISHGDAADDDIRLLRWLPELETLHFHRCWGVTTAALRYLAGHPRLKILDLNGPLFTAPLRPLARCPALESLEFFPEGGAEPGDAHTVGLDRIVGLRRLKGWTGSFTEPTLIRVGRLTELRYLSLELGKLRGDDSLRPLARLRELEYLALTTATPLSDECLRHLARMTRLRALELHLEVGDGEGLRHLAAMGDLQFLTLYGHAVTDAGLRHLKGLTNLRVVQLPSSRVTSKGAAELAEALPEVAVHRLGKVVKSLQQIVRFRRQAVGDFASALIPVRWRERRTLDGSSVEWTEDGFESFDEVSTFSTSCAEPAGIRLWIEDVTVGTDAASYLRNCARFSKSKLPKRFQSGVVQLKSGGDTAAGSFPKGRHSCLVGIAVRDGRATAVQGQASPGRFALFRGLFAFVAASLRVGPEALIDEEVDLPAAELA